MHAPLHQDGRLHRGLQVLLTGPSLPCRVPVGCYIVRWWCAQSVYRLPDPSCDHLTSMHTSQRRTQSVRYKTHVKPTPQMKVAEVVEAAKRAKVRP